MAVKVTANLRQTWMNQREQMLEERTTTQSGRPRPVDDILIVDHDIAVMDYLLRLPVGAKFDAREVDALVRQQRST